MAVLSRLNRGYRRCRIAVNRKSCYNTLISPDYNERAARFSDVLRAFGITTVLASTLPVRNR